MTMATRRRACVSAIFASVELRALLPSVPCRQRASCTIGMHSTFCRGEDAGIRPMCEHAASTAPRI